MTPKRHEGGRGGPGLRWRDRLRTLVAGLFALMAVTEASAQAAECRLVRNPARPSLRILQCDSLTIIGESGADFDAPRVTPDGELDVQLRRGAVLLEYGAGARRPGVQISTPQAIASVRGTVWAVEAKPDSTAVFVVDGVVNVSRPGSRIQVPLRRGQGIDVRAPNEPARVTRWSPERARALLDRFGR